jgi:cysteinyl-tRNA synthetase
MTNDEIDRLVKERDDARARGDFATADAIRKRLTTGQGWRIALLDEPQGTFWYWTQA